MCQFMPYRDAAILDAAVVLAEYIEKLCSGNTKKMKEKLVSTDLKKVRNKRSIELNNLNSNLNQWKNEVNEWITRKEIDFINGRIFEYG